MRFLRWLPAVPLFLSLVSSLVLEVPQSFQQDSLEIEVPPLPQNGLESFSNTSANFSQIATNSDVAAANDFTVRCSRDVGRGLRLDSCMDVVDRMSDDTSQFEFGERGTGHFDVNLPYRKQSGPSDPLLGEHLEHLAHLTDRRWHLRGRRGQRHFRQLGQSQAMGSQSRRKQDRLPMRPRWRRNRRVRSRSR